MEWTRLENESEEHLLMRLATHKDEIGTWDDIAAIMNELTGKSHTESKWRKDCKAYRQQGINFDDLYEDKSDNISSTSSSNSSIDLQRIELEKERKKLQTEKIEYNKWLRENARDEMIFEQIHNAISQLKPLSYPPVVNEYAGDKEYLLCFGDTHYGAEFEIKGLSGEVINAYSPDIFERRMWELQAKVIDICGKEEISVLNIVELGDFLDGLLRISQLMRLRYGVVDSTIHYSEFISKWLNNLSAYVKIRYQNTYGNHDQLRMLGQPKNTFTDDNMGKIISAFIKCRLENNPNFEFIENPTSYIYMNLCGYNVLGIHGEVKNMEKSLHEFSKMYGVKIDYLLAGHLHHSKIQDVGSDSKVINIPSIIGTDPYAQSLGKVSDSGANLFVFEEGKGISCQYNIKLN